MELIEDGECLLIPTWNNVHGNEELVHTLGSGKIRSTASDVEKMVCVGGDIDIEGKIETWIRENTNPESPPRPFPEKVTAATAPKLIANLRRLAGNRVSLTLMGSGKGEKPQTATVTKGLWDDEDRLQGEFSLDLDA